MCLTTLRCLSWCGLSLFNWMDGGRNAYLRIRCTEVTEGIYLVADIGWSCLLFFLTWFLYCCLLFQNQHKFLQMCFLLQQPSKGAEHPNPQGLCVEWPEVTAWMTNILLFLLSLSFPLSGSQTRAQDLQNFKRKKVLHTSWIVNKVCLEYLKN